MAYTWFRGSASTIGYYKRCDLRFWVIDKKKKYENHSTKILVSTLELGNSVRYQTLKKLSAPEAFSLCQAFGKL